MPGWPPGVTKALETDSEDAIGHGCQPVDPQA